MKKYKRINPNRIHLITQGNDKPQTTEQVTAIPAPVGNHGYPSQTRRTFSNGIPLVIVKKAEK
jgi:hypothetical protein